MYLVQTSHDHFISLCQLIAHFIRTPDKSHLYQVSCLPVSSSFVRKKKRKTLTIMLTTTTSTASPPVFHRSTSKPDFVLYVFFCSMCVYLRCWMLCCSRWNDSLRYWASLNSFLRSSLFSFTSHSYELGC